LYGREVVVVVADGDGAVDGLRWVGALAEDEKDLLVDLQRRSTCVRCDLMVVVYDPPYP
jgi:hypothetical protein